MAPSHVLSHKGDSQMTDSAVTISTKFFTYHKKDNQFTAERSDLGPLRYRSFGPNNIGFILESHKTGRKLTVVETKRQRDGEGELLYTEYKPIDKDYDFTVIVYND